MQTPAPKAKESWLTPAIILIGMIAAWWLFVVPGRLSAAEAEVAVHDHLRDNGGTPDELCAQAGIVEREFVREGNRSKAELWALTRKAECSLAYTCRLVTGGCLPSE